MKPINIHRRFKPAGGGGGGGAVSPGGSYTKTDVTATVTCTLTLNSSGTWSATDDAFSSGSWLLSGVGGDYEVLFEPTSGTLTGGSSNVWERLNANRGYNVQRSSVGSKTCTGNLKIRQFVGGALVDNQVVTLTATKDA